MTRTSWDHAGKSARERGYGWQWTKLRNRILKADPLCRICGRAGIVAVATSVDHITPKAKGGTDDPSNLQAVCVTCHDRKTAEENGRRVRPIIGLSGWPVE